MHTARLGDRSLFPDLEPFAYLNHAAISPPSLPVREAVRTWLDHYARHGVASFPTWQAQRERLRGKLATLVGVQPEDVALIPNTTQGVIDIALCFPWRAGDRVILFRGEFPANVTPWLRAADLYGLEIEMLPLAPFERETDEGLAVLEDALRRGARLVAVSAVEFQTGLRMPVDVIAALCHHHGAELFVDGIQGCGVVPMDIRAAGVDYFACGSHKWLMGAEGAGFLYVRPERVSALRPVVAGWLSHEEGLGFLFEGPGHLRYDRPIRRRADFVEAGNYNGMSFAALEASVDLITSIGVAEIHAHVASYLDLLEAGLRARGFTSLRAPQPERRSGTLGVVPPQRTSVVELHRSLTLRGVSCSIPDGVLRFAPHWPNDRGEVPAVLDALDEALDEAKVAAS